MKTSFKFAIFAFVALFLPGCANPGIVQTSPNTYLLSREDHGGIFGSASALKAGVFHDANAFAARQGKSEIPISAREHSVGIMGDWASFELSFRLVETDSPETKLSYVMEREQTNPPSDGTFFRPDKFTDYIFKPVSK